MDIKTFALLMLNLAGMCSVFVEVQRHFEFEDTLNEDQSAFWVWRSEASNLKTLRLEDPYRQYLIEIKVCVVPTDDKHAVVINLDDIRYSNDGPTDNVLVTFDGAPWAVFETYEKWAHGYDWNIFRNTGRLGYSKFLQKGEYVIGINVVTDKWGIELDKIRLNAEYQEYNTPLFCGGRLTTVR